MATVTLDSPGSGNLVDAAMAEALRDVCCAIAQDDTVRVVVITGNGGVFSVGNHDVDVEFVIGAAQCMPHD